MTDAPQCSLGVNAARCRRRTALLAVPLFLLGLAGSVGAQVPATPRRADIVRGRVVDDSGRAMPRIRVIATMAPDRISHFDTTDADGRYTIQFERGTGDYLVYAAAPGYRTFRRRSVITRPDSVLVADVTLSLEATVLAPVRTSARRPVPRPDGGLARDPTGAEQYVNSVNGMVPPDEAGDIRALASSIPGISVAADGSLSAFGLPGQVNVTLNGVAFDASAVPRNARSEVRITTTAYDPAIGGFGGARVNVELLTGRPVSEYYGRATLDAFQMSAKLGDRGAPQLTHVTAGLSADGWLANNRYAYNTALQFSRRSSPSLSLLDATGNDAAAEIAGDSVAHFRQIAQANQLPLRVAGLDQARTSETASLIARFDRRPPRTRSRGARNFFSLTTFGAISRSDLPGSGLTVAPASGRGVTAATGQVIGQWVRSGPELAAEVTTSLSGSTNRNRPYVDLPGSRVAVVSSPNDAGLPIRSSLIFGGSSARGSESSGAWETNGTLNFYAAPAHRIKLYGRTVFDARVTHGSDDLGEFTFASLADLAANRPASFSLFGRGFSAPRSWRGNLQWSSSVLHLRYLIDAAYSANVDQRSQIDRNLVEAPSFVMAGDGNRPVFAPSSSIVPATGLVAAQGARRVASYGRVYELRSDARSTARQVSLVVSPNTERSLLQLGYTFSDVTQRVRGFDGVTFGSPALFHTERSPFVPRHSFVLTAGRSLLAGVALTGQVRASSGIPYSALINADVNGDGLINDLAYIPSPADSADDPDLARDLALLRQTAPPRVRRCLDAQRGTPPRAGRCEGPWTFTMNAALSKTTRILDGRLATVTASFANPLGLIDRLVHGSNELRGWGAIASADPVLYTVESFDPDRNRFRYAINPTFGGMSRSAKALGAPFRIVLDVRIELGEPSRARGFRRFLQLRPDGPGHLPAPPETLQTRLSTLVADYYTTLIADADSLLLTGQQIDVLERAEAQYVARVSPIWRELAQFIYVRRERYDLEEVVDQIDHAIGRVWAVQRDEVPHMLAPLAPAQRVLVMDLLKPLIESDRHRPPSRVLF